VVVYVELCHVTVAVTVWNTGGGTEVTVTVAGAVAVGAAAVPFCAMAIAWNFANVLPEAGALMANTIPVLKMSLNKRTMQ